MFLIPEPPPINYYLDDVMPSFLSDGVLLNGTPGPTHKFVAKQLVPVKRAVTDPVAPLAKSNHRTLAARAEMENGFYVDPPGRDAERVHEMLSLMPVARRGQQRRHDPTSVFPRPRQWEYSYIGAERIKNQQKRRRMIVEETPIAKEEVSESDGQPCHYLRPPFWWKDKEGKPLPYPVGCLNDYAYEKPKLSGEPTHDEKMSHRLGLDDPKKYTPGNIHRIEHPEDTNMMDTLARADNFQVIIPPVEKSPEKIARVCRRPANESVLKRISSRDAIETQISKTTDDDNDRRWQPLYDRMEYPKTERERNEEVRQLSKSHLHDLHSWYSKNRPVRLISPIIHTGKRPILEYRFSHF